MTDRPILFSAPMVRALLAGTKAQTRRVVKHRITGPNHPDTLDFYNGGGKGKGGGKWVGALAADGRSGNALKLCPYGVVGDTLWVRETWRKGQWNWNVFPPTESADTIGYKADWTGENVMTWKPSIHMPRWASRISLRVTDVRVERVQEISEADALAEGMHEFVLPNGSVFGYDPKGTPGPMCCDTAREAFLAYFASLAAEPNPYVWVISFEPVTP